MAIITTDRAHLEEEPGAFQGERSVPGRSEAPRRTLFVPPPAPPPPVQFEPEAEPLGVSPKSFVGPNATYYDDRWRWMDWRGRSRSWNWAAAATFGGWLAYRRMYRSACVYAAWLASLVAAAVAGVPPALLVVALVLAAVALGFYGNKLYFRHFLRLARELGERHPEHEALTRAAVAAGGVDRRAAWRFASGVFGLALLLLVIAELVDETPLAL